MIEKLFCWLIFSMVLLMNGCALEKDPARIETELAYFEAVNMNIWPQDYVGKTRTVSGKSMSEYYPATDKTYYCVAVSNYDGTYTEKVEYLSADGQYPGNGTPVAVTGEFEVYQEYGVIYCRLKDAQIILKGDI